MKSVSNLSHFIYFKLSFKGIRQITISKFSLYDIRLASLISSSTTNVFVIWIPPFMKRKARMFLLSPDIYGLEKLLNLLITKQQTKSEHFNGDCIISWKN